MFKSMMGCESKEELVQVMDVFRGNFVSAYFQSKYEFDEDKYKFQRAKEQGSRLMNVNEQNTPLSKNNERNCVIISSAISTSGDPI